MEADGDALERRRKGEMTERRRRIDGGGFSDDVKGDEGDEEVRESVSRVG